MSPSLPRRCMEVQRVLPALRDGRLLGWRARAVRLHLRRCADCRSEEALLDTLGALKSAAPEPPAGLLDDLLAAASDGGHRRHARGAVSGARPVLSAALLVSAAVAGTGVGLGVHRGVRRV